MEQPPRFEAAAYLEALAAGETPARRCDVEAKARIRLTVAQALAQGRMGFHYQPVVKALSPRFPAFFEMLARLTLPSGQILPASVFLPHVEGGPLGRAIDRLALSSALAALRADASLRLSINMSPLSIGDADWLAILNDAAPDRRTAGRLIFEITETAALENSGQTLDFMNHVRSLGCAFALDDFGAGATGFRHFRDFRFDIVKIDGSFAHGVSRSPDSKVLVECLLAAARHFEMLTVAERIECDEDAETLRRMGVDCLQGYRFGRPAATPTLPEEDAAPLQTRAS